MSIKPYVIGIGGGTCSGKTTLVKNVIGLIGSEYTMTALHMDKYYKNPIIRTIAPITGIEYAEANHPDSLETDRLFSDFNEAVANEKNDIVIIEGLFSLHYEQVREKLDLRVFVDLKSDERMYRRIKRWMDRQSVDDIAHRYLDTVRYRHDEFVEPTRWRADMIINGTLESNMGTEILITYIREAMKARKITI